MADLQGTGRAGLGRAPRGEQAVALERVPARECAIDVARQVLAQRGQDTRGLVIRVMHDELPQIPRALAKCGTERRVVDGAGARSSSGDARAPAGERAAYKSIGFVPSRRAIRFARIER